MVTYMPGCKTPWQEHPCSPKQFAARSLCLPRLDVKLDYLSRFPLKSSWGQILPTSPSVIILDQAEFREPSAIIDDLLPDLVLQDAAELRGSAELDVGPHLVEADN